MSTKSRLVPAKGVDQIAENDSKLPPLQRCGAPYRSRLRAKRSATLTTKTHPAEAFSVTSRTQALISLNTHKSRHSAGSRTGARHTLPLEPYNVVTTVIVSFNVTMVTRTVRLLSVKNIQYNGVNTKSNVTLRSGHHALGINVFF